MTKIIALLFLILIASCKTELKRTLEYHSNGNPFVQAIYPDISDTTSGKLVVHYPDGSIFKEATLYKSQYIDRKVTYYQNGQISQIDSLAEPCDTTYDLCNGMVVRYYENGNISQRYTVKNHEHNGLTQQFTSDGKISKEYELLHDTIKNGIYHEFYDNGVIAFSCNYKLDTIVGYAYYFDEKGDTLKFHNHYKGIIDFPYQKWLDNGLILFGNYTDKSESSVTWIWFDKNRKETKRKVARAREEGFAAPE